MAFWMLHRLLLPICFLRGHADRKVSLTHRKKSLRGKFYCKRCHQNLPKKLAFSKEFLEMEGALPLKIQRCSGCKKVINPIDMATDPYDIIMDHEDCWLEDPPNR